MRVIYSYKHIQTHGKGISNTFIKLARLSVEMANRFYETELYCDMASKYFFEKHNIPFTRIIVLPDIENYTGNVFCYPKIATMLLQSSPYIHIDFDTIIINKLHKSTDSNKLKFAYPEVKLSPTYDWQQIEYVYKSYIKPFKKYSNDKVDFSESVLWRFNDIPNNSVIYVNNPNIIKTAYESILSFIGMDIYDKNPSNGFAQYVEQFLLSQYLINHNLEFEFIENTCNFAFQLEKDKLQYRTNSLDAYNSLSLLLNEDFIHFHNYIINEPLMLDIINYLYISIFNKSIPNRIE